MKLRHMAALLVALSGLSVPAGLVVGADTVWSGAAGNSLWTDAGNWGNGVPSRTTTDTAVFDNGSAAGGSVTLGTGSNFRPKNTNWRFQAGAMGYTFAGADFVDNQSNTRTFVTDTGMVQDQTFASPVRIANHTITMNGSGDLGFVRFWNDNAWGDTTFNTGTWAVNHADAVLSVGQFEQARGFTFTKSGAGTLVVTGSFDFPYGKNGAAFVSSRIIVSGGTVDLSGATIKLESRLDTGEALTTGSSYTLVDYSAGTLAGNANFATAVGAPVGWHVAVDTLSRRIVLREIPPQPRGTVVLLR